jgi:uncharacterized membrane protein YkvA (DUF1232 family)
MSDLAGIVVALVLVTVAIWLTFVAVLWLHRPSRELAGAALRLPPDVLRLSRALVADPATPRSAKIALGALAAYLVSPIDLVPDFLPVIGSLDDVIVAGLVLRWVGRRIGIPAIEAHWSGSPIGLAWLLRLV